MSEQSFIGHRHRHRRGGFIERLVADLLAVLEHAFYAERMARTAGLLQRLDPRVKVLATVALICSAVLARHLPVILGLFIGAVVLAYLSSISLRVLTNGVWTRVVLFTGAIALPALCLVPGEVLYRLPLLDWPVTRQGLESAALLLSRAETAATLAALLILSTPWTHVLKALRVLGVPAVLVIILGMTHRYLFLLLQTAHEMFEARQSRLVGTLTGTERRRLIAAGAGVLLSKSIYLANEVFLAMQSRGYRGEHFTLDEFELRRPDWVAIIAVIVLTAAVFRFGS